VGTILISNKTSIQSIHKVFFRGLNVRKALA